ncbi:hypothetical protein CONLIGDRAFT_634853 [Coniochaeta ligniaria NRRL 30616]|uniref:Secreted protein n=1 Tax=Coniochaeta ligniaria NRRL 30616 TaxID=1408157 RepID=A0A1J7IFY7_9PEZI|nr:hypothetical protein CONLIGDRAFT_634853 [Coniochaeta ligniaria NRRL 30616]
MCPLLCLVLALCLFCTCSGEFGYLYSAEAVYPASPPRPPGSFSMPESSGTTALLRLQGTDHASQPFSKSHLHSSHCAALRKASQKTTLPHTPSAFT